MTDLETAIRDALHSRAAEVPIRQTAVARRRRRWTAPLLAAASVIALVAITLVLTQGSTTKPATPAAPRPATADYAGHRWKLVAVDDELGHLVVPTKSDAMVSFGRHGSFAANDTVNYYTGKYRPEATGYLPGTLAATAAGYAGSPRSVTGRIIGALRIAMGYDSSGALTRHVVPVRLRANLLIIAAGSERATFVRAGPA